MASRDITIRIRANTAGLVSGIKSAQMNVASFSKEIEKSAAKKAAIRDLGTQFGKMGLVAAVGVGLAVRSFANFQQAMSNVKSLGADARLNFDALSQAAIKWGQRTQYSATEAASGIEELMKAGVSAKDVLGGGLQGALNLAAAGQISVAEAASTAASAMVQFNLRGKDVPHIADLLAAAANKAQGGVTDMGTALKYVGPIAAQMGVSIEETTGTIAELAQNGVLADQAGTGLRGMLLSLTSPSSQAAAQMETLGINVYDAQGKFVGFKGVAGQLHDTMKNLTAADRDNAFGRIFGNAQITAARILYKGGAADIAKWTAAVNAQGYAADTARTRMDNLKGDLEQLRGALQTALITTGGNANGPLRAMTQDVTGLVNAYSSLPSGVKGAVLGLGGLTAAFGGSVFVASRALTTYTDVKRSLDELSTTAPGAAAVIGKTSRALTALAVAAAAFQVAGAIAPVANIASVDRYSKAIRGLSTDTGAARKQFDHLFKVNGSGNASLSGLADTLKATHYNVAIGALDKFSTVLGAFDSNAGLAKKSIGNFDSALTELATSGHTSEAAKGFDLFAAAGKKSGLSMQKIRDLLPQYSAAAREAALASVTGADKVSKFEKAQKSLSEQFGITAKQQAASEKASSKTANQFVNVSSAVTKAKDSLKGFEKTLLDQAKALTNFGANATKALAKGLDSGLVTQLEQMGPAGAKIMAELAGSTQSEIAKVNAAFQKGGDAINNYVALTGTIPTELVTQFLPAGASGAVATAAKVANAYHLTPDTVRTILKALDYSSPQINAVLRLLKTLGGQHPKPKMSVSDAASKAIKAVKDLLAGLDGKTAKTYVVTYKRTATMSADGNIFEPFANGGIQSFAHGAENHIAQIAGAGSMRLWAEPETGGEAYIPLAPSKRQRSLEIFAETGKRLGVQGFADGGISDGWMGAPVSLHLTSGALDIRNGQAYVEGIASLVVGAEKKHAASAARRRIR